MSTGVYLAMTGWEMGHHAPLPPNCGWMACRFSSSSTGLSNLPDAMPEHGVLCIDDSLLPQGHDPVRIARQAGELCSRFSLQAVILDFQRESCPELAEIARKIQQAVSCCTAVTPQYAENWPGAVFLPPVPLNVPIEEALLPWKGKEIWLEISGQGLSMVLKKEGCTLGFTEDPLEPPVFHDPALHCHYHIALTEDAAVFTLKRTARDIQELLEDGRQYGVIGGIGLYQELGSICPPGGIQ